MRITAVVLLTLAGWLSVAAADAIPGEVARFDNGTLRMIFTSVQDDCDEGSTKMYGAHVSEGPFSGCWFTQGPWLYLTLDSGRTFRFPKAGFGLKDA